jgi:hypothetical protein
MAKIKTRNQTKDILSFLIENNSKGVYYVIGDKYQNIRLYKNRTQIAYFSGVLDEKTVATFIQLIMSYEKDHDKTFEIQNQNNDTL